MMETCDWCGGEGEVWNEPAVRYDYCPNCGGEGWIDLYYEDEWYEEEGGE